MMAEITRNYVSPTHICENPLGSGQDFLFYSTQQYTKPITSYEALRALKKVIDYTTLNERDPGVFISLGRMLEKLEKQSESDSQQEREFMDIYTGVH